MTAKSNAHAKTQTMLATKIAEMEQGELRVEVWRCPLPLPNALRWVNGYLLVGAGQRVVIDPGFQNEATQLAWMRYLEQLQLSWESISDVLITHYHPDHSGMAGWMQRKAKCTVWMSEKTREIMQRMWGTSESEQATEWSQVEMPPKLIDMFRVNGLDRQGQEDFAEHFYSFQELVSPQVESSQIHWLRDGESIGLAGLTWQILFAEGHASGQCMLWHEPSGWLFCADHVLPDISPNITVLPEEDGLPLDTFLGDLKKVRDLEVKQAYPGHRGVIREWSKRIDELIAHHEMRLSQIEQLVSIQGPVTAWGLVPQVYARIDTVQQSRFALAEMIAHLRYLEVRGRIRLVQIQGINHYSI